LRFPRSTPTYHVTKNDFDERIVRRLYQQDKEEKKKREGVQRAKEDIKRHREATKQARVIAIAIVAPC